MICAGGGGIPTVRAEDGRLEGVDAVYARWGTANPCALDRVIPAELEAMAFDSGSMGPKVEAARHFVGGSSTRRAAIGALSDAKALLDGSAGTQIRSTWL